MQAVILAGGLGTRLRGALTPGLPKVLAPVEGRPFIDYLLDAAVEDGASDFLILTGYAADQVHDRVGSSFRGAAVEYSVEATPLGTGGALRHARSQLDDRFLLLNGDTYCRFDLSRLLGLLDGDGLLGMGLARVAEASRFGSVRTRDGFVVEFSEKTSSGGGLINAGAYAMRRTLLDLMDRDSWSLERDLLAPELTRLRPRYLVADGPFLDIGVEEDYRRASTVLMAGPR